MYVPDESAAPIAGSALAFLTTPLESRLEVRVEVERAAPNQLLRDGAGYRIGDTVRFGVSVNQPCHVALLALSAGGGASVLLPNGFRVYRRQPEGAVYVPDRTAPEYELPLLGPPGTQLICALATRVPLPGAMLNPEKSLMRQLRPDEADELADAFQSLPAADRAVGWCRFEVNV
jgi:hypothetical protein